MMDLSFIANYFTPIVMLGCLIVGYLVKKWVKDVDNKYIPTIVAVLGAILSCVNSGLTMENIIGGAVCGLASTGLHQVFKNIIEGKDF